LMIRNSQRSDEMIASNCTLRQPFSHGAPTTFKDESQP
jgi:hypothetical protein